MKKIFALERKYLSKYIAQDTAGAEKKLSSLLSRFTQTYLSENKNFNLNSKKDLLDASKFFASRLYLETTFKEVSAPHSEKIQNNTINCISFAGLLADFLLELGADKKRLRLVLIPESTIINSNHAMLKIDDTYVDSYSFFGVGNTYELDATKVKKKRGPFFEELKN
jgi:hypothetical protein